MEDQARFVTTLPERERLDFFRSMVLYCDLNDSRATLFCELVDDDADALRKDLFNLKSTANFQALPTEQRKNVEDWIPELRIVAEQRGLAVSH